MAETKTTTRQTLLISAALAVLICLAFEPVRHNEFVDFDDNQYLFENTALAAGLNASSAAWAFTAGYAANWHPLTWLSHALDIQLFGLNPAGHHVHNVLLHAAAAVLLFLSLKRMTGAVWRSAFVALAFGIHPLRVESVAWAAERKDVLSGLFFMLTLWAYARWAGRAVPCAPNQSLEESAGSGVPALPTTATGDLAKRPPSVECRASSVERRASMQAQCTNLENRDSSADARAALDPRLSTLDRPARPSALDARLSTLDYALVLIFFALGLMSKPMLVSVPLVLLLLDYWPLRRLAIGDWQCTARLLREKLPLFLLAAASCVVTYLVQQHGHSMTPDLPPALRLSNALTSYTAYLARLFWPSDLAVLYPYPVAWPLWKPAAAALLLAAITVFVLRRRSKQPYLAAGWFWFVVTLIPVIGIIQVGAQSMADRYTYLPSIGIFIMTAWGLSAIAPEWQPRKLALAAGGILAAFAMLVATRAQIACWKNSVRLFQRAVAVTANNHVMHHSLGWALAKANRLDEAEFHLGRSLDLRPDPETTLDFADVLIRRGQLDRAAKLLGRVLQAQPTNSLAHYNLGVILQARGQFPEAAAAYEQAVRFDTNNAKAWNNLGILKTQADELDAAAECFRRSLRLAPGRAATHRNFAAVLHLQGLAPDAIAHCRAALQLDPKDDETSWTMAYLLHASGQLSDAIEFDRRTLRLNPNHAGALNDLAWILATTPDENIRNPAEAMALARKACELAGFEEAEFLDTLAAACAGAGRFEEAIEFAARAVDLARKTGNQASLEDMERRLNLYRSSKP